MCVSCANTRPNTENGWGRCGRVVLDGAPSAFGAADAVVDDDDDDGSDTTPLFNTLFWHANGNANSLSSGCGQFVGITHTNNK